VLSLQPKLTSMILRTASSDLLIWAYKGRKRAAEVIVGAESAGQSGSTVV
jgi:hypothetical protein